MIHIQEIEAAKKAYYKAMAVAKEVWVKSENTWEAKNIYNETLALAEEAYDRAVAVAMKKL